jgi:UDP-4-amino-4-deoxy-L-arabinose formyltransferase/UDP-glucuronic acid dehydrogenase (UDP-4-keto-hexauronic acid decarboxylating)
MVKVLLVGGSAGAQTLAAISKTKHRVEGVIGTDGLILGAVPLQHIALSKGLTVWPVSVLKEPAFARSVATEVDVLISVRSRSILPPTLIEAPRYGSYNVHFGPLPKYAGRNVVSWALYNGEVEHGVTLHRMVEKVDCGGIVSASHFALSAEDNALSVTRRCLRQGLSLLTDMLDMIEETMRAPELLEQSTTGGRYYLAKEKPDMRLDWRQPSAELLNLVRAADFHPFPSPWGLPVTTFRGQRLQVLRMRQCSEPLKRAAPGTVVGVYNGTAIVAAGDKAVRLERVLLDGCSVCAGTIVGVGTRFHCPEKT